MSDDLGKRGAPALPTPPGGEGLGLRPRHFQTGSMGGNALEEARQVGQFPPMSDDEILFSFVMSCKDPMVNSNSAMRQDLTRLFHRALGSPTPAEFEARVLEFLNRRFNVREAGEVLERPIRSRRLRMATYDDETRQ